MKALVKREAKVGLWLEDVPVPKVGAGEVKIKIKKTSICGTDLHIYKWDKWAQKTIPLGMTVGHEFSGIIEEVGAGVNDFVVGERVSGEGHICGGHGRNCLAGRRHLGKTARHEDLFGHLAAVGHLDDTRAHPGDNGRVLVENAEVALLARHDHHFHRFGEQQPLGRDQLELHLAFCHSARPLAFTG